MSGLDRHVGIDASMDAQDIRQLRRRMLDNADRRQVTSAVPEDRATGTTRFERKHRYFEPATWPLPGVCSAANCLVCHTGADKGRYREHALRMP